MSSLNLTEVEEEQVHLISRAFGVLSKTLLCQQEKAHFHYLKYLLESMAKGGHNQTKSLSFVLKVIGTSITADRLAYLVGVVINTFGVSNKKILRIQKAVMTEFVYRYENYNRSPSEIWYECQLVQDKLNGAIDSLSKEYRLLKKEFLTRREELKRLQKADGNTKIHLPKSTREDQPSPPFSEHVLLRKQHAFAKIVSATQALLLTAESSAHFLFANLAVEAIFTSSPGVHELCQSTRSGKNASEGRYLGEFEKLVLDYSSCLERIFSTLNIHEMLTVYLRSNHSRDASKVQKLLASIGERLRANGNKQDFLFLRKSSFQSSLNNHGVCNIAYEAYITLLNTFRKAERLLHRRNLEALRLNYLNGKLRPHSSKQVKMRDKLQVPNILVDIGIFWTPKKVVNGLSDLHPSSSSLSTNVYTSKVAASSTGRMRTLSSEQQIKSHSFVHGSLPHGSHFKLINTPYFGDLPDPSLLDQEETENRDPSEDFDNEGPEFVEVDRFLSTGNVIGGYGPHHDPHHDPGLVNMLCEQGVAFAATKKDTESFNPPGHMLEQKFEKQLSGNDKKTSGAEELVERQGSPNFCFRSEYDDATCEKSANMAGATQTTEPTNGLHMSDSKFTTMGAESVLMKNKTSERQLYLTPLQFQSGGRYDENFGREHHGMHLRQSSTEGPFYDSVLWLKGEAIDAAIVPTSLSTQNEQSVPISIVEITDKAFVSAEAMPPFTLNEAVGTQEHIPATEASLPHNEERNDVGLSEEIQEVLLEEANVEGGHNRLENVIESAERSVKTALITASVQNKNSSNRSFGLDLVNRLEGPLDETKQAPSEETVVNGDTSEQRKDLSTVHWDEIPDDLFSEQYAAFDAGCGLNTEKVLELPFDADSLLNGEL